MNALIFAAKDAPITHGEVEHAVNQVLLWGGLYLGVGVLFAMGWEIATQNEPKPKDDMSSTALLLLWPIAALLLLVLPIILLGDWAEKRKASRAARTEGTDPTEETP